MSTQVYIIAVALGLLVGGCGHETRKLDLKGSWYLNSSTDSTEVDYTELYFNDSTYYPQSIVFGQWYRPQKYRVTSDSIFLNRVDDGVTRSFYIVRYSGDSLFLRYVSAAGPVINGVWIRLPKTEKGHYDHRWTEKDADSLDFAVRNDFHRRMMRYYYRLDNDLKTYDSLFNAGNWNFTMKDVIEEKESR